MKKGQVNSDYGRGGELNTIIGKSSEVVGDLAIQNSLRVDGKVKGNVHCTDTVIIGKGGMIEGHIAAKNVMLAGKVIGNISAESKVFLESTASVKGDVMSTRLVVDEGAVFDGKCAMEVSGSAAVRQELK